MTLTVTQLKFDKGFVANVLVSPIVSSVSQFGIPLCFRNNCLLSCIPVRDITRDFHCIVKRVWHEELILELIFCDSSPMSEAQLGVLSGIWTELRRHWPIHTVLAISRDIICISKKLSLRNWQIRLQNDKVPRVGSMRLKRVSVRVVVDRRLKGCSHSRTYLYTIYANKPTLTARIRKLRC